MKRNRSSAAGTRAFKRRVKEAAALRDAGLQTRDIARKMGCSTGYARRLLRAAPAPAADDPPQAPAAPNEPAQPRARRKDGTFRKGPPQGRISRVGFIDSLGSAEREMNERGFVKTGDVVIGGR